MGADNWAVCPKCEQKAYEDRHKLLERIDSAYGRIPLEEFDALREQADKEVDEEDYRTLREDYELGINTLEPSFYVYYEGRCNVCDFSKFFEHVERLDTPL